MGYPNGVRVRLLDRLEERLGLPKGAYDALELVGIDSGDPHGPCYTIPMRSPNGVITGVMRRYREPIAAGKRAGKTKLVYEMDYRLKGMLRFLGGALAGQYAAGIREQMDSLKDYIESGKGPKVPK